MKIDKLRVEFEAKRLIEMQQRFKNAMVGNELAKYQNITDLQEISEKLVSWYSKLYIDNPQKKVIMSLINAVFRIQGFCSHLDTVSRAAVTECISERIENDRLKNKINELENEIKSLKAEIGFIENNSKP